MYNPVEINKDLFYVGVNDRSKHLFENLWPLPKGVSYNSYVIRDEKTALIDTVDIGFTDVFLNKLSVVLGDRPVDYLIINHMEPDHSGALTFLLNKYPNIQLVGNARTADMLEGFYNITENIVIIKDKEELSLGNNTLQFFLTPMVHWPETMMTYVKETKTIFAGDAFGTFGTLDGGVIDSQLNPDFYWDEMVRYYSNIVGKYGGPVQKALKKMADLEIETICPTHGPVWTEPENIERVISLYDKLSKYETEKGLVIAYGSMYGNTEQLAEAIAAEAAAKGVKNIVMHNMAKSHISYVLQDVFKYKALIIGSPTYDSKLYPAVQSLLNTLENKNLKNRYFGYFGGHSWAGTALRLLGEFADKMQFENVFNAVDMKQSMGEDIYKQAMTLGSTMAEKILSDDEIVPNK
ncbi:MAG: FprA family A-type flavoprotein, partial [Dysgonamonadaceae bacterium]|nr:FprA family A-type flavoprotein [Dysgonamonadaceae bacterium]MDD3728690.1 FprA family A-type flavoprotein [Dysgonamonadaceae bacterium]MDD4246251.1 FprA family A-type flavoprotein [Dysgonamonadaceae bacterium]HUI33668.1 FprA family A-type flavoprotein [Dysgonamonadaceae bacterium]